MTDTNTTDADAEADDSTGDRSGVTVPRRTIDDEPVTDRLTDNVIEQIGPARYFQPGEDWDDVFDRVASDIASAERRYGNTDDHVDHWFSRFRSAMAEQRFIPNTPTIASAGTELQMLSACFVCSPEDSMESILGTATDWGLVEKAGGGMGGAFYHLRPKGAHIASTNGRSSGPMPFIEMYDAVGGSIKQGATLRSGAQMAIMHAHHADVGRFCVAKRTEGRLANFNISVAVTDEFIDAVENDASYRFYTCDSLGPIQDDDREPQLVLPETKHFYDPAYEDAWNDRIDQPGVGIDGITVEENLWRDYDVDGIDEFRDDIDLTVGEPMELPARFIWQLIVDGAWENGEPGVYHIDETNRGHSFDTDTHPDEFMAACNPCCATGTLVDTPNGYQRVESISVGDEITTVHGTETVDDIQTFKDQDIYRVEFSDGGVQHVTEDHRYHAHRSGEHTKFTESIALRDLSVGDRVHVHERYVSQSDWSGTDDDYWHGVRQGILLGDGCYTPRSLDLHNRVTICSSTDDPVYNDFIEDLFAEAGYRIGARDEATDGSKSVSLIILDGQAVVDDHDLTPALSPDKTFDDTSIDSHEHAVGLIDGDRSRLAVDIADGRAATVHLDLGEVAAQEVADALAEFVVPVLCLRAHCSIRGLDADT